jgi:cell wall-associated NlpC family hydrolase
MPSASFDRRLTPARADLAAEHLRGLVDAPRYSEGRATQVAAASAPLRRSPQAVAPLETEALHGESVTVYDESEGWAWVQLDRDSYVGYMPAAALGAPAEPTHRVAALRTHAYPGPSIKLTPRMALSLGARLTIVAREGDFAVSADGLHVWLSHLAEIGWREPDYVAVAERFLETPYLWGGRTSEGIDCSGLVQTALAAAGAASPRDSDMQEAALGEPIAIDEPRTPLGSRILEGACRNHARFRHAAARQRLAHEGRQRAAGGSSRPDRRQRRRECDEPAKAANPSPVGRGAGVRGPTYADRAPPVRPRFAQACDQGGRHSLGATPRLALSWRKIQAPDAVRPIRG